MMVMIAFVITHLLPTIYHHTYKTTLNIINMKRLATFSRFIFINLCPLSNWLQLMAHLWHVLTPNISTLESGYKNRIIAFLDTQTHTHLYYLNKCVFIYIRHILMYIMLDRIDHKTLKMFRQKAA